MPHVLKERLFFINKLPEGDGPVVYWMSRDQRVKDNWALLYAQERAKHLHVPLIVVFALAPSFLGATLRQYDFLLKGLIEVEKNLADLSISFFVFTSNPPEDVFHFVQKMRAGLLVMDFDPLRIKQDWQMRVAKKASCACVEVDAHNVVPARFVSQKREYGARTIRPKIHKLLSQFLVPFPKVQKESFPIVSKKINWKKVYSSIDVDKNVLPVEKVPGEAAANRALHAFVRNRLRGYAEKRNDPNEDAQSGLSAYFHFGQLAPARAALLVSSLPKSSDRDAFLEELIVRRELADNFCLYTPSYDTSLCFPAWAVAALHSHASDAREYLYTKKQFEEGKTHDPLWNAAQMQMVQSGTMHGYMRMYWAKKILEWTKSPEEAMRIAVYLNDKYELDGRDPNGYAGIAWSIGGVHDRAWFPRPIFGTVRYMSYNGAKGKFDIDKYITKWT